MPNIGTRGSGIDSRCFLTAATVGDFERTIEAFREDKHRVKSVDHVRGGPCSSPAGPFRVGGVVYEAPRMASASGESPVKEDLSRPAEPFWRTALAFTAPRVLRCRELVGLEPSQPALEDLGRFMTATTHDDDRLHAWPRTALTIIGGEGCDACWHPQAPVPVSALIAKRTQPPGPTSPAQAISPSQVCGAEVSGPATAFTLLARRFYAAMHPSTQATNRQEALCLAQALDALFRTMPVPAANGSDDASSSTSQWAVSARDRDACAHSDTARLLFSAAAPSAVVPSQQPASSEKETTSREIKASATVARIIDGIDAALSYRLESNSVLPPGASTGASLSAPTALAAPVRPKPARVVPFDSEHFLEQQHALMQGLMLGVTEATRQVFGISQELALVLEKLRACMADVYCNVSDAVGHFRERCRSFERLDLRATITDLHAQLMDAELAAKQWEARHEDAERRADEAAAKDEAIDRLQARVDQLQSYLSGQLERNQMILKLHEEEVRAAQRSGGAGGADPAEASHRHNDTGAAHRVKHRRKDRHRVNITGLVPVGDADETDRALQKLNQTIAARRTALAQTDTLDEGHASDLEPAEEGDLVAVRDAHVQVVAEEEEGGADALFAALQAFFGDTEAVVRSTDKVCHAVYGTADIFDPSPLLRPAVERLDEIGAELLLYNDKAQAAARKDNLSRNARGSYIVPQRMHADVLRCASRAMRELILRVETLANNKNFMRGVELRQPRSDSEKCMLCGRVEPDPALLTAFERFEGLKGELKNTGAALAKANKDLAATHRQMEAVQGTADARHEELESIRRQIALLTTTITTGAGAARIQHLADRRDAASSEANEDEATVMSVVQRTLRALVEGPPTTVAEAQTDPLLFPTHGRGAGGAHGVASGAYAAPLSMSGGGWTPLSSGKGSLEASTRRGLSASTRAGPGGPLGPSAVGPAHGPGAVHHAVPPAALAKTPHRPAQGPTGGSSRGGAGAANTATGGSANTAAGGTATGADALPVSAGVKGERTSVHSAGGTSAAGVPAVEASPVPRRAVVVDDEAFWDMNIDEQTRQLREAARQATSQYRTGGPSPTTRVPTGVLKLIAAIYRGKLHSDLLLLAGGSARARSQEATSESSCPVDAMAGLRPCPEHVVELLQHRFGTRTLIRKHTRGLLTAIAQFGASDARLQLFGLFVAEGCSPGVYHWCLRLLAALDELGPRYDGKLRVGDEERGPAAVPLDMALHAAVRAFIQGNAEFADIRRCTGALVRLACEQSRPSERYRKRHPSTWNASVLGPLADVLGPALVDRLVAQVVPAEPWTLEVPRAPFVLAVATYLASRFPSATAAPPAAHPGQTTTTTTAAEGPVGSAGVAATGADGGHFQHQQQQRLHGMVKVLRLRQLATNVIGAVRGRTAAGDATPPSQPTPPTPPTG